MMSGNQDVEVTRDCDEPQCLLVVSNVRIVREGLMAALTRRSVNWSITLAATLHAATATEQPVPDVVLVEMGLLNDSAASDIVARIARRSRVVAFAAGESDEMFLNCVEWGIVGFVLRESSIDDLVQAVASALRGEATVSPRLTARLIQRISASRLPIPSPPQSRLTRREEQILALIDDGLSNKEIARKLFIELATVKNHVHSILEKTRSRRRSEAAAIVRRSLR